MRSVSLASDDPAIQEGQTTIQPFRFDIEPDKVVHSFYPEALAEQMRISDTDWQTFQRTQVGAAYIGDFGSLPNITGSFLWEVEIDIAPPATIKALKPKLWLLGEATLAAGSVYQIM